MQNLVGARFEVFRCNPSKIIDNSAPLCYDMHTVKTISARTEKYPRGRRGSPAKGVVRVNRSQGSNPCFSAKQIKHSEKSAFLLSFGRDFPHAVRCNIASTMLPNPAIARLTLHSRKRVFFIPLLNKSLLLRGAN